MIRSLLRRDQCKYTRGGSASDHNKNALTYLLPAVVAEILPARAAFRFRKVVLKEMCFCEQYKVEADNVECFYDSTDDEEAQEELQAVEPVLQSVYTADNEKPDVCQKKYYK